MGRWSRGVIAAGLALAAIPGVAAADGLPVLGIDVGSTGVTSRDGATRYVTLPAGAGTLVARIATDGGQVLASALVSGNRTIPAVAYDGSASGASGDGTRLALIEPRTSFPRQRTRFTVVETTTLRSVAQIDLRGDFSFDAISPDGAVLYLTHYTSPNDPTIYDVRAYDVAAERLGPPILDPAEPGERMGGVPITRLMSDDGRWAFTLYDRVDGHEPFIHALDTASGSARCIDLEMLAPGLDPTTADLVAADDGTAFTVTVAGRPVAVVDHATLTAVQPASESVGDANRGGGSPVWGWIVGSTVGVVLAGVIAIVAPRTRRRGEDAT